MRIKAAPEGLAIVANHQTALTFREQLVGRFVQMPLGALRICQVSNQLSGKLVNAHASEVIELLSLEVEDNRAKDDRYEDATAVEYFSVHDLPPYRGPRCVSLRFRISRDSANDLLTWALSWFEFIDFRRDIVVGSFFGGHQFLGKATPKITLRCFHQPGYQIFRHSVDRSILIDFGVDRISEAICRDALDENANLPTVYRWNRTNFVDLTAVFEGRSLLHRTLQLPWRAPRKRTKLPSGELSNQQIRQSQPRDLDYFFELMATVRVSFLLGGERFHGRLNRSSVLSDVPAKATRLNRAGPGYKVIRLRRLSHTRQALQSSYPRPKSLDLPKRVVAVLPRWKLAGGLYPL